MSNATTIVFRGARIFDGESDRLIEGHDVLIAGATIQDVIPGSDAAHPDAEIVHCGGLVLMPGLIDAHVHVYLAGLNITRVDRRPCPILVTMPQPSCMRASTADSPLSAMLVVLT